MSRSELVRREIEVEPLMDTFFDSVRVCSSEGETENEASVSDHVVDKDEEFVRVSLGLVDDTNTEAAAIAHNNARRNWYMAFT